MKLEIQIQLLTEENERLQAEVTALKNQFISASSQIKKLEKTNILKKKSKWYNPIGAFLKK